MYRTIESSFWTDPKVRDLTPGSKLLFLYLITNQHSHVSGIYYLNSRYVTADLGITESQLGRGIDTLSSAGFVRFDEKTSIVWVVNMFRYQGCGEKSYISASRHLCSLHNSFLCNEFANKYPQVLKVKNGYRIDTLSRLGFSGTGTGTDNKSPPPPLGGDCPGETKKDKDQFPEIPGELNTPDFQDAWASFLKYRQQRKPKFTPESARQFFRKWTPVGPERTASAIRHSMANNWQGVFEENDTGQRTKKIPTKEDHDARFRLDELRNKIYLSKDEDERAKLTEQLEAFERAAS